MNFQTAVKNAKKTKKDLLCTYKDTKHIFHLTKAGYCLEPLHYILIINGKWSTIKCPK